MDNIFVIEEKLKGARARLGKAIKALAPKHKGGEMEEFQAARENVKSLEREYSLAQGLETALKIPWQPEWNTGAPLPHIISSEQKIFLVYLIREIDPHWDGTSVKVIDSTHKEAQPLALVEFKKYYAYKSSSIDNEVWTGHPLDKRGLEGYSAHHVENSQWLKEEKKIHSVRRSFKEEHWSKKKHFLLLFHDTIFECIAEDYSIEIYNDSFENVVKSTAVRLFEN